MLQDVSRGRPIELDALLTSVQEMGRLAGAETPLIDSVLALAQQMGRVKGIYPTFPETDPNDGIGAPKPPLIPAASGCVSRTSLRYDSRYSRPDQAYDRGKASLPVRCHVFPGHR
ncbi:ketopantoate reductase C-terminal domain-containing protein [Paracoccus wurundjeri]|uniref:ketopantoate reductase C-terminal domain-containing protein n=1 Tax=Paracoccus onubensis TaxID=1675788 RepID=UPI00351DA245